MDFINIDKWRALNETLFKAYIDCYYNLATNSSITREVAMINALTKFNVLGMVTEKDYSSFYTIARELGIFYQNESDRYFLSNIANDYVKNKISYPDYLKYYVLNTEFLINGEIVHPFEEIIEVLKTGSKGIDYLIGNLPKLIPDINIKTASDSLKKFLERCTDSGLIELNNLKLYSLGKSNYYLLKGSINHSNLSVDNFANLFIGGGKEKQINVVNKMIEREIVTLVKKASVEPLAISEIKQSILTMVNFNYNHFIEDSIKANYKIENILVLRFISSLLTKPFVILTGLAGSGKTKLAQAFALWICENNTQYAIVPVGADWTNREPLLGFPNALQAESYVKPENKALQLIIDALNNPSKPYFLILDEMNLSHVERYFADFLSAMESKDKIALHSGIKDWDGVPASISLPKNLFVIGTVNIDETTYMFSPTVLDRASVIEFRVTKEDMEDYLASNSPLNLDNLKGKGAGMSESFVALAKGEHPYTGSNDLQDELVLFFENLKKVGAEFGYRSASEILRFAAVVNKIEPGWETKDIIDAAIMQKLLPKVHGSRRKLDSVLVSLLTLCLTDGEKTTEYLSDKSQFEDLPKTQFKYPISAEKIIRMYKNLISNGFTSYAEA